MVNHGKKLLSMLIWDRRSKDDANHFCFIVHSSKVIYKIEKIETYFFDHEKHRLNDIARDDTNMFSRLWRMNSLKKKQKISLQV